MKNTFVADIREREPIEDVFLVREKIMALAKNGKPYMTVKLMDRTGEVEGRIWDRVEEFDSRFQRDDFLRIRGKASLYLGKMQVVVQDLARVPESEVDLGEFLPVSERPREEMVAAFRAQVAGIRDPDYRNLLEAFAGDESFLRKFSTAAAAKACTMPTSAPPRAFPGRSRIGLRDRRSLPGRRYGAAGDRRASPRYRQNRGTCLSEKL